MLYLQALLVGLLPDFTPSGRYSNTFYLILSFTHVLAMANSSVNFFFYCALGSKYRDTLRSCMCSYRKWTNQISDRYTSQSGPVTVMNTVEEGFKNG